MNSQKCLATIGAARVLLIEASRGKVNASETGASTQYHRDESRKAP
jgi:hypothetical protein